MQESQLYIPTKENSKSINNVQHNVIKINIIIYI